MKSTMCIGWRARNGGDAILGKEDISDRKWYGSIPELITDIRGEKAEYKGHPYILQSGYFQLLFHSIFYSMSLVPVSVKLLRKTFLERKMYE